MSTKHVSNQRLECKARYHLLQRDALADRGCHASTSRTVRSSSQKRLWLERRAHWFAIFVCFVWLGRPCWCAHRIHTSKTWQTYSKEVQSSEPQQLDGERKRRRQASTGGRRQGVNFMPGLAPRIPVLVMARLVKRLQDLCGDVRKIDTIVLVKKRSCHHQMCLQKKGSEKKH